MERKGPIPHCKQFRFTYRTKDERKLDLGRLVELAREEAKALEAEGWKNAIPFVSVRQGYPYYEVKIPDDILSPESEGKYKNKVKLDSFAIHVKK